jgi:hypothetical protein
LIAEKKLTLFDISLWNEDGSWKEWSLRDVPTHMFNQAQVLISLLKVEATILRDIPDSRGWETYGYSVKE